MSFATSSHAADGAAPSPPPPRRRGKSGALTRAEELRGKIADDIIGGRLAPGSALEEVEIAKRYGVSRTPVREALRDLAAAGLVEMRPHRSALVAQPTVDRLTGMFGTMAELEALCAGLAAVNMTAAERAELQALHAELADLTRQGDAVRYAQFNERFHALLCRGSHNDYLAELAIATRARTKPFRGTSVGSLGRLACSFQEHDHVVRAVLRGDRAEAFTAMRTHILDMEVPQGFARPRG